MIQNENVLVQERREIMTCGIFQKARGDGMQCLRRGLDLNMSCLVTGRNMRYRVEGGIGDLLKGTRGSVLLISFIFSVK